VALVPRRRCHAFESSSSHLRSDWVPLDANLSHHLPTKIGTSGEPSGFGPSSDVKADKMVARCARCGQRPAWVAHRLIFETKRR